MAIIDRDYVEWSNLQRQQLYTEEDARQRLPKAMAAKARLLEVNSDIHIDAYAAEGTAETRTADRTSGLHRGCDR